jgi:hypothetical protein
LWPRTFFCVRRIASSCVDWWLRRWSFSSTFGFARVDGCGSF